MENSTLADNLSTLGHPQRLAVFQLLVRRFPDALSAGEVASTLGLKASTCSVYLSALVKAGVITGTRQATHIYYQLDQEGTRALVQALCLDTLHARVLPPSKAKPPRNVLFLCTGNSARSIMAEALLRHEGQGRFNVFSAGGDPYPEINPIAADMLAVQGIKTHGLRPKHEATFRGENAPQMDLVITVCDDLANKASDPWPGAPLMSHWGVPDPVAVAGTQAEKRTAFLATLDDMYTRIRALVAIEFADLDPAQAQDEIDAIGRLKYA